MDSGRAGAHFGSDFERIGLETRCPERRNERSRGFRGGLNGSWSQIVAIRPILIRLPAFDAHFQGEDTPERFARIASELAIWQAPNFVKGRVFRLDSAPGEPCRHAAFGDLQAPDRRIRRKHRRQKCLPEHDASGGSDI